MAIGILPLFHPFIISISFELLHHGLEILTLISIHQAILSSYFYERWDLQLFEGRIFGGCI